MKTYTVKITETNVAYVLIQASSAGDAEDIARQIYDDDYIDEPISMDEGGVEFNVMYESEE